MTLRAKGARKRRGSSPRWKEECTRKVCPEVGRERRLMYGHLGAPERAAVHRERRAPAAGSRAFIKDAGRRFAAIPHIRLGHADLAAGGTCPVDPRRAQTSGEGSALVERFVGIDVALREHRIAVLDRDGEAVGPSFTIAASKDGVATLLRTLDARGATAAQTLIGLEASGHLWENLEAALIGAGYRVIVLNPLQTRRYRDVVRRKASAARAHVVRTLVSQLERLTSAIDEVDRAATALLPPSEPGTGPSDAELLQTIPGIGPQTAATLLGELGALTRFTDARALVAYVGFYPVINQSGDRAAAPRLSPVGSRIARPSLYLAAVNAVRRSGEWRTIYLRKKAQGKTAKQALVVVAVKLLHAVYAMLKHRQPYNPSRLLVAPATIGS